MTVFVRGLGSFFVTVRLGGSGFLPNLLGVSDYVLVTVKFGSHSSGL